MRKILCLILLALFCAGVGKVWYLLRDGFSLNRLSGWNQTVPGVWWEEEAESALQQKFYYLSRGRQCFAFVSEDGHYVIKLPRADHFRLPLWLRAIKLQLLDRRRADFFAEQTFREAFILESFRICFDEVKDLTAVIGMHLSNEGLEGRSLYIVDPIGRCANLPLKSTYFILQHKKDLFKDVFKDAFMKKGTEGAEKVFDVLLSVITERARRGILNKDGSFLRNFAYDEKQAYQIDVGSFYRKEHLTPKEAYVTSIEHSAQPIRAWLKETNPELLAMFDKKLESIYEESGF